MASTHRFSRALRWRLKAVVVIAFLAVSSQVAFASAEPVSTPVAFHQTQLRASGCSNGPDAVSFPLQGCGPTLSQIAPADDPIRLTLPTGSRKCPSSGPSASCNAGDSASQPTPGMSSLPDGMSPCAGRSDLSLPNVPGSCNDTLLPAPQPAEPAAGVGTTFLPLPVAPSVPSWTLSSAHPQQQLRLTSNVNALQQGQNAILTATAGGSITGTRSAIEIFDQTTGTLVGACVQASQCLVAYAAQSGAHTFAAYITPPVAGQPTENVITSNLATVALVRRRARGLHRVRRRSRQAGHLHRNSHSGRRRGISAGALRPDLGSTPHLLQPRLHLQHHPHQIAGWDPHHRRLRGGPVPDRAAAGDPSAVGTDHGHLARGHPRRQHDASRARQHRLDAGDCQCRRDQHPMEHRHLRPAGKLGGDLCKSGTSCIASVTLVTGAPVPWFTAVIGAARQPADSSTALVQLVPTVQMHSSLVNIQARSAAAQPTRLLWGVDSCKPLTSDPSASAGLYAEVRRHYGKPDFWGRYLTTSGNCPGISSTEITAAIYHHLGILPIYNNYDCSAVNGYPTGLRYATEAVAAAANLGIPAGTVLAIDIEPPGPYCPGAVNDAGIIEGWYDGITIANYAPMYYGNGTASGEFESAWCGALIDRPDAAVNSYLWSFEPSLDGTFTERTAPQYSPQTPGCAGNVAAWQHMPSTGAKPDVDSDEALSRLPLWFPAGGA